MAAANRSATTDDKTGGVARHTRDYCDQAATHLKAGRLEQAYVYANEAVKLDERDAKTTALRRYALYALHPKRRLIDKSKALQEEADRFIAEEHYTASRKAYELLSLAKAWHCTPSLLWTRSRVHISLGERTDLAYVDVTEAMAMPTCNQEELSYASRQVVCLRSFGYKVLPTIQSEQQKADKKKSARQQVSRWPKGLQIHELNVNLPDGYAEAITNDGATLKPPIPLKQLAQFLNEHVQGAIGRLGFDGALGPAVVLRRLESAVPRLLDEITAPGRLHTEALVFTDFFHVSGAEIARMLDGRARARIIHFVRLELPSGVDADEFLRLPTIHHGSTMILQPFADSDPLPTEQTLFSSAAVLGWAKSEDGHTLFLPCDYLASGLVNFIDAFKKDFRQATQVHPFQVSIYCPNINVVAGLGVRPDVGCNSLDEKMMVYVGEDHAATIMMSRRFETVTVRRLPPS